MAKQLTERQQEIKRLLDEGKTPGEVAALLGVTENAIYQQSRRIKQALSKGKSGSRRATTRRQSGKKQSAAPMTPTLLTATEIRHETPLQAIRRRRGEVETTLHDKQHTLDTAKREFEAAQEALDKAREKIAEELARLEAAENALTGAKPATQKRQPRSRNGKAAETPAPAPQAAPAPAPEPVAPAPEAKAELAAAQAEAPTSESAAQEERPGVPTVPGFDEAPETRVEEPPAALVGAEGGEFEQPDDGFGE